MAMYTAASPSVADRSQAKINEETETIETNAKKKCLEQRFAEHDLCPFKLQWSFGMNPEAPVINLTTENRALLAYACSHVAVIYDYSSRKMLPLLGHVGIRLDLPQNNDNYWQIILKRNLIVLFSETLLKFCQLRVTASGC
ncbi:cilia- and flagella-associated protein 251-like [Temnothorax nylanderi]|uniref:cilia- and flagella-associated protein 251-like n=1 Tax=Temnothorax nylanderi TaxID=102681 RepID=UPI003A86D4C3